MNSNKDYEALHKFLLPNMKLEDVLVDMNDFKNEPAKPEKPKEFPPLESHSPKPVPEDDKTEVDTEVEKKSRKQKRLQKRLQERNQNKLIQKSKKETEKKKLTKEALEERLKQIKESIKDEKKKEGLEESDVKRLTRVIFGEH
jgi:hypothetical protein